MSHLCLSIERTPKHSIQLNEQKDKYVHWTKRLQMTKNNLNCKSLSHYDHCSIDSLYKLNIRSESVGIEVLLM